MSTDISTQRFKLNEPTVAAEVIDGEAIILNLAKGDYYNLCATGADFWRMLVAGHSATEIATAAAEHFGVDSAQVESDLRGLIERFVADQLIVAHESGAAPEPPLSFITTSYENPGLSVFSDVRELLALDPPLPEYNFAGER